MRLVRNLGFGLSAVLTPSSKVQKLFHRHQFTKRVPIALYKARMPLVLHVGGTFALGYGGGRPRKDSSLGGTCRGFPTHHQLLCVETPRAPVSQIQLPGIKLSGPCSCWNGNAAAACCREVSSAPTRGVAAAATAKRDLHRLVIAAQDPTVQKEKSLSSLSLIENKTKDKGKCTRIASSATHHHVATPDKTHPKLVNAAAAAAHCHTWERDDLAQPSNWRISP